MESFFIRNIAKCRGGRPRPPVSFIFIWVGDSVSYVFCYNSRIRGTPKAAFPTKANS